MSLATKVDCIAAAIQVAMGKGLTSDQCYEILKEGGYSDEDLHLAFLKVAANFQ